MAEKKGDTVQRDEPLLEISTDKVDAASRRPPRRRFTEIKIVEGATVQINTVVATISDGAGTAAPAAPVAETAAAPADDSVTPAAIDSPATDDGSRGCLRVVQAAAPEVPDAADGRAPGSPRARITKWLKLCRRSHRARRAAV